MKVIWTKPASVRADSAGAGNTRGRTRRMRTVIAIGALALPSMLMLIPLCIGVALPEDTGAAPAWEAQYTGQIEPVERVISTQLDFEAVGNALFRGSQLPGVDFKKNVAVCVCLGERSTVWVPHRV